MCADLGLPAGSLIYYFKNPGSLVQNTIPDIMVVMLAVASWKAEFVLQNVRFFLLEFRS